MDAFHHQDAVGAELDAFAVVEGVAFEEVESGYLHPFSIEHSLQVVVEQGDVEGVDGLEIVLAVGQFRGAVAADEVVVKRQLLHVEAQDGELYAEAAARGGLARRGGPSHKHHTHLAALAVNHVGNLGVAFLMQGFGDVDELYLVVVADDAVEVSDGGDMQAVDPQVVQLEDIEEFWCLRHQGRPVEMVRVGHLEQVAFVGIGAEIPRFEAPR